MSVRLFEGEQHAKLYSDCRSVYPAEFVKWIVEYVKEKRPHCSRAVDVGCGSGQFTRLLAEEFEHVLAVDVSEAQIAFANKTKTHQNIDYRVSPAETLPVPDSSVDVVTAFAAVHWFNLKRFFEEVDRVLHPNGCVFLASYPLLMIKTQDSVVDEQTKKAMEEFSSMLWSTESWSDKRKVSDKRYADIVIPYQEKSRNDSFEVELDTTIAGYIGFIRSLSGSQTYIKKFHEDATLPLQDKLMKILGSTMSPEETRVKATANVFCVYGRKPGK